MLQPYSSLVLSTTNRTIKCRWFGGISHFFGHPDSSLLPCAACAVLCFETLFPYAQWQWHAQRLVRCQRKANLWGQRTAAQMPRCPDVQMSRCPSKTAYQWSEAENAFLLPHCVVRPQFSAHVSPATSSMNGQFWVEIMSDMSEYVEYNLSLKVGTSSTMYIVGPVMFDMV